VGEIGNEFDTSAGAVRWEFMSEAARRRVDFRFVVMMALVASLSVAQIVTFWRAHGVWRAALSLPLLFPVESVCNYAIVWKGGCAVERRGVGDHACMGVDASFGVDTRSCARTELGQSISNGRFGLSSLICVRYVDGELSARSGTDSPDGTSSSWTDGHGTLHLQLRPIVLL
jgi:hypothetical protein